MGQVFLPLVEGRRPVGCLWTAACETIGPEAMSDRSRTDIIFQVFPPGTGTHYDEIVDVTTAGRDRLWKEELLGLLDQPRRVLDLACGTGILTFMLRDRFPDAEVVGVDVG